MRKRGRNDIPDGVVYTLAVVLGICIGINAFILTASPPGPALVPFTGLQTSTGTVSLTITGGCLGPLVTGWNLVSLCANVTNANISAVMSGIDFRYVMRWNETAQRFDTFSPSSSSNPFTTFEVNRSYFVYLNSASDDIEPTGEFNPNMNITLTPGWTAPAYPYEFNSNFTLYFNNSFHRYHLRWNATTQQFTIWSPRMSDPPPSRMYVGDGQFILSEVTNNLTYVRSQLQT